MPTQTEQLSHQVALLEVLLDLQIAEIRAYLGQSSPAEVNIVGIRVAANVMLPELAKRLAETRERADAYESYLKTDSRAPTRPGRSAIGAHSCSASGTDWTRREACWPRFSESALFLSVTSERLPVIARRQR
jgi:hypothetical protein